MKKIPYATQLLDEIDKEAVAAALDSAWLTQGPKVKEFERQVADYCDAKYAVAVNSGTAALHAACFAAGIKPGDEVITSPNTFVASANCILYCGGKPIFADIDAQTLNVDPAVIEQQITSKTKAIIPVHFAGQPCALDKIQALAKKHKLMVVEDAAHAIGAEYRGQKIGSAQYSDLTVFSFHAVKNMTTGEGGMVLTNNHDFYQQLLDFRTHGITRDKKKLTKPNEGDWYYEMNSLGFNYRLTDFQAALGLSQLGKLNEFIARRRAIVKKYNQAFEGISGLILPKEVADSQSAWHLYVIRVKDKHQEVFAALRQAGILVNVHYIPVYWQPYYQNLGYKKGLCLQAEAYYRSAITLPLYPKMSDQEQEFVIERVINAVNEVDK